MADKNFAINRIYFRQSMFFLFTISIVVCLTLLSTPGSKNLPEKMAKLQTMVASLTPQGWAFFTKTPLDPNVMAYEIEDEAIQDRTRSNNSGWMRLSREYRIDEFDNDQILAKIEDQIRWETCYSEKTEECLKNISKKTSTYIEVKGWDLRLCGNIAFVKISPIPFEYARYTKEKKMDVGKVRVECKQLA